MHQTIPFNKLYLTGNEVFYIQEAIRNGKITGDGLFTKKCHQFFEDKYHIQKALLTTSCTDALELSAILSNIKEGDEVIMPSYTFVSTANPFILQGASIRFCDSNAYNPNINSEEIEALITPQTKAIVVVHYAGIACDMAEINRIAKKHQLLVIEDAAQAVDAYYNRQPLGSIGDLGAYSFHETKNIVCGEGGLLAVNNSIFAKRAEIIREKGTNRSAFFRGEVDKYGWVDKGSSFLPSDMLAAFLFAQLEQMDTIQSLRMEAWQSYLQFMKPLAEEGHFTLPLIPQYAQHNAHTFFIICKKATERSNLISFLKSKGIASAFHYLSLHKSEYFAHKYDGRPLPNSDRYTDTLLRLPLYAGMTQQEVAGVSSAIKQFFEHQAPA